MKPAVSKKRHGGGLKKQHQRHQKWSGEWKPESTENQDEVELNFAEKFTKNTKTWPRGWTIKGSKSPKFLTPEQMETHVEKTKLLEGLHDNGHLPNIVFSDKKIIVE